MTTETTGTTTMTANNVIVVGMLDTMLVRDRTAKRDKAGGKRQMIEVTRKQGRDRERGGRWENLALQVRSPYGGMFAMKIELEPDVPGAELLAEAEAETLLAFEGTLQLKRTFDGRFAHDGQDSRGRLDRGLPTRALQLHVTTVRKPSAEERRAGSAVWLEGEVAEPPQVSRHPELPSVQLAGTIVRVRAARESGFPGLGATIHETVEVNVAVPTSSAEAEGLYRQGNRVRIAGQLDCRMERQGGPSVAAKLAELDTAWEQRKVELADKPQELREALRRYRSERMRFEESARLYVLALGVELIDGEPLPLQETYEARRAWVRMEREQREARRARTAADREQRAARPKVEQEAGELATSSMTASDEQNGTEGKALRPRRRAEGVTATAEADAVPALSGVAEGNGEPA